MWKFSSGQYDGLKKNAEIRPCYPNFLKDQKGWKDITSITSHIIFKFSTLVIFGTAWESVPSDSLQNVVKTNACQLVFLHGIATLWDCSHFFLSFTVSFGYIL